VIGAAVLIVALTAAGGGYLTYLGMRDPRHLPDSLSMIVAAFMLLVPFAVSFAGRRMAGLGGIIPVDEPSGKEKSPSRRGARLGRTN
jgi:drug/metabolite transporter superfamily protein YnfA